jgi:hypothetical protein
VLSKSSIVLEAQLIIKVCIKYPMRKDNLVENWLENNREHNMDGKAF